jgi:hypothetical protein
MWMYSHAPNAKIWTKEPIIIIISPLIALMKDQFKRLNEVKYIQYVLICLSRIYSLEIRKQYSYSYSGQSLCYFNVYFIIFTHFLNIYPLQLEYKIYM